jgi:hypothetical protein
MRCAGAAAAAGLAGGQWRRRQPKTELVSCVLGAYGMALIAHLPQPWARVRSRGQWETAGAPLQWRAMSACGRLLLLDAAV